VASLLSIIAVVRSAAGPRVLLFARIDWKKHQGVSRVALGAPSPKYARDTYTVAARREQKLRQLKRRGGIDGFMRALAG
jgi:hypothetical protein